MKKEFSSSLSWNNAALAGLVMGVATIAADYLTTLPALLGGGAVGAILSYILKIAKIVACVCLFRILMVRFHDTVQTDYSRLQRYGLKIALFSSILVAGFSLAQILVLNPDSFNQIMAEVLSSYQSMMDSNTMAAMEKMMAKLPAITFFSSLVYCYIWGWVLSTTFARRFFPVNVFGERAEDNQDNNDNIR